MQFFGLDLGKKLDGWSLQLASVTLYYYLFLVLVVVSGAHLPPAWQVVARRARLDGHPRRRNRRQGHGHQHPQHEAAGLRHGRRPSAACRAPCLQPSRASSRRSRFSLMESVMIVAMVVLGGVGHLPGVILGAVLLSALPEVLRYRGRPLAGHDRRAPGRGHSAPAADRPGHDQHHAACARVACGLSPEHGKSACRRRKS